MVLLVDVSFTQFQSGGAVGLVDHLLEPSSIQFVGYWLFELKHQLTSRMQPQTELLPLVGPREHEALLLQQFRRDYGAQVRKGAVTKPVDMVCTVVQVSHG